MVNEVHRIRNILITFVNFYFQLSYVRANFYLGIKHFCRPLERSQTLGTMPQVPDRAPHS